MNAHLKAQEKFLHFTQLRYCHDVAIQEFVVVGIIGYSQRSGYLKLRTTTSTARIKGMWPSFHLDERHGTVLTGLEQGVNALQQTLDPFDLEHAGTRFTQLLLQILPPSSMSSYLFEMDDRGFSICENSDVELERLFRRIVLHYEPSGPQLEASHDPA